MLKDNDGNWVQDDNQLKNMAVQFFKLIYTDPNPCYRQYHLIGLFPSLCDSDLANISHLVDDIEIWKALCDISPLKAQGIEELHSAFYQSQWLNIGTSVCNFIKEIFEDKGVPHEINRTLLVLTPKRENAYNLNLFIPISLCTVIYKYITKIIVNRIKSFLSKLISLA